jgi:capsule polysaccharide export protein KpsE/RkpR
LALVVLPGIEARSLNHSSMKLSATLALLALLPAKAAAAESSPDTLALLHEVEALRAELAQMRESRRLTGSVSEAAFNASIAEARDLSLRGSRVCVCRCVDS